MAASLSKASENSESVAIVGGGISGLSVAYTLVQNKFKGKITVVEKTPTLGGNAATAKVVLGTDFRGDGLLSEFVRFADLGVNDVNLNSYKRLHGAMSEIKYPIDDCLRPLEDTVAFFTRDFQEIWTKDGYLTGEAVPYSKARIDDRRWVVDTRYSLHDVDKQLARDEHTFMQIAAADFSSGSSKDIPNHRDLSVAEYVEFFSENRCSDAKITEENLRRLVRLFLYPRISAMYFADPAGPENMPMLGVMSYYILQEGIEVETNKGKIEPDRRYFTHGSQHWINALAQWLENENVEILHAFDALVAGSEGRIKITNAADPDTSRNSFWVDKVVMTGHADDQLESFIRAESDDKLLSAEMEDNLRSIKHSFSHAYAHTWNRLLPPDQGTWRTYNVTIRPQDSARVEPTPYQMTYVQNRHRNDRHHPEYNQYGMPIYFVSLNPAEEIPDEYILRRTTEDELKAKQEQAGYASKLNSTHSRPELATATFRHTIMTKKLLEIQADLPSYQGMANKRVFFAGCWSKGAGLHEECFDQAEKVVAEIL